MDSDNIFNRVFRCKHHFRNFIFRWFQTPAGATSERELAEWVSFCCLNFCFLGHIVLYIKISVVNGSLQTAFSCLFKKQKYFPIESTVCSETHGSETGYCTAEHFLKNRYYSYET